MKASPKLYLWKELEFIKIFKREFKKHGWWYSDGEQPISNGKVGLLINEKKKKIIEAVITCCSNCGDYNIIEAKNLRHEFKKEKK